MGLPCGATIMADRFRQLNVKFIGHLYVISGNIILSFRHYNCWRSSISALLCSTDFLYCLVSKSH